MKHSEQISRPMPVQGAFSPGGKAAGRLGRCGLRTGWPKGFGMMLSMTLGACVSVNAPDKPIVIELNINIKQEVIYRLSSDAGQTIQSNKGIF